MVRPGGTFFAPGHQPDQGAVLRQGHAGGDREAAGRPEDDLVLGPRFVAHLARLVAERREQTLQARVVDARGAALGLGVGRGPRSIQATARAGAVARIRKEGIIDQPAHDPSESS